MKPNKPPLYMYENLLDEIKVEKFQFDDTDYISLEKILNACSDVIGNSFDKIGIKIDIDYGNYDMEPSVYGLSFYKKVPTPDYDKLLNDYELNMIEYKNNSNKKLLNKKEKLIENINKLQKELSDINLIFDATR